MLNPVASPLSIPSLQLAKTPWYTRRFAWAMLVMLLAIIPALGFAPWTQTSHGLGQVIAFNPVLREQFIISPIEGRVQRWHVVEGDRVKAGQLLVELVDNDPQILERLREQETLALQRLTLAEGRVIDQESRLRFVKDEREVLLAEAQARIDQAQAQVLVELSALQQAKADLEREQLNYDRRYRLHTSAKGQLVSRDELEEAERKLRLAAAQVPLVEARVELAEKIRVQTERQKEATDKRTNGLIQSEEAAVKIAQGEQASVRQQYNQIVTQVQRQANQRIYAPVDGTLYRILANAEAGGQLVRPGERLAVLVPRIDAEKLDQINYSYMSLIGTVYEAVNPSLTRADYPGIVAELMIDGNDLPLVQVGDEVLLQFEGWAAVQFVAYPRAAAGTFRGRIYLVDPTADERGRFRILVEPAPGNTWPDEDLLRQGVRAQGWVILNEVRLGYEIWRVLNGFPPIREVPVKKESRQWLGIGPVARTGGK